MNLPRQNRLDWAFTRHRLFNECLRKYYLQYYLSWGGQNRDASPDAKLAHLLKGVAKLDNWVGMVIHNVIAYVLTQHQNQREIGLAQAQKIAKRTFEHGFSQSERREWQTNPRKRILFPHYYDWGIEEEQVIQCEAEIARALQNLYESDLWQAILATDRSTWQLQITDSSFRSFAGLGGRVKGYPFFHLDEIKVFVSPDFGYYDRKWQIIDWKTNPGNGEGQEQLQLHCYALHLAKTLRIPVEAIETSVVSLLPQLEQKPIPVGFDELAAAANQIRDSHRAMSEKLVNPDYNLAHEEDFPAINNPDKCRWCNFRELCQNLT